MKSNNSTRPEERFQGIFTRSRDWTSRGGVHWREFCIDVDADKSERVMYTIAGMISKKFTLRKGAGFYGPWRYPGPIPAPLCKTTSQKIPRSRRRLKAILNTWRQHCAEFDIRGVFDSTPNEITATDVPDLETRLRNSLIPAAERIIRAIVKQAYLNPKPRIFSVN